MYRLTIIVLFLVVTPSFSQNPKWQNWETAADTLLNRGEFKAAVKLYTKILDASKLKDRTTYGALYKRAVSFYSMGEFENALKDLDRFVPEYPQIPQARLLRALVHKELGHVELQLSDLDQALQGQPSNVELLKWRAALYLEEEKFELARKDALLAKLLQDDAEIEMYLGVAQYNLGETDSALLCINQAIALEATYMPAYLYGGTFCLEHEQYAKALEYLNLALRLEPKNGMAIFYKGVALIELGKTDEGCSCLRKAFYLDIDDASDYLTEYCFGVEK